MDGNLFKKYEQRIQKNKTEKEDLLRYIEEKTNVKIEEKEISLSGKNIKIHVSSTKKMVLQKSGISLIVKDKGYTLSL
jgi:hypothetical protein